MCTKGAQSAQCAHRYTVCIVCIVYTVCTKGAQSAQCAQRYTVCIVCIVCIVCTKGTQSAQCAQRCTVCTENPTSVHATSGSLCPGCMEQAVPNLTAPRVYQSPGGAGARWAGPDELFLGYRFLRKSVFAPVLPRPQNGPGSSRQAKTWSNRPSTRIVPDESVCAEIGHLFLVRWSTKDGPLNQSTICPHIAGKDTGLLQISTYYRIPTVIKSVLWLIANR